MLTRIWRGHASWLAVGLVSVAFAAAGCGGGGDEGQGGQSGDGGNGGSTETQAKTTKDGKPKPEAGAVVQDFEVDVVSAQLARITATLVRPAPLELRVRREAGENNTKVGNVEFGRRPAGAVSINWNLQVAGKRLPPGRYLLVLSGGQVGKSERVQITVPG